MAADKTLQTLLDTLTQLGDPAAELAADQLRALADKANSPWEALALDMAAQAVLDHGPDGVDLASQQIVQLLEGKRAELDLADARLSHALLAAMERQEGLNRRQVREWFTKLGKVFGALGVAFLAGVASGALKVNAGS